jgi:biotin carboxylase
MERVLLVLPISGYRNQAYEDAVRRNGATTWILTEAALLPLPSPRVLPFSLERYEAERLAIVEHAQQLGIDAVVGVDDQSTAIATDIADALGLIDARHHQGVFASLDKYLTRTRLGDAELPLPRWQLHQPGDDVLQQIDAVGGFPVVVKPRSLNQSRGVVRADDVESLRRALALALESLQRCGSDDQSLLVEEYVDGVEFAVEGVLHHGDLTVLAVFDKPDPLVGPYFEESIYVVPTILGQPIIKEATRVVQEAVRSLGLSHGPIHAELRRLPNEQVVLIEVAPRTIGGRCASILRFDDGRSLEEVVVAEALGDSLGAPKRRNAPAGVLMLPTASNGIFRGVRNLSVVQALPGITGVEITAPVGSKVLAPPLSERYIGFIFASGPGRSRVIAALRHAAATIQIEIEPFAEERHGGAVA